MELSILVCTRDRAQAIAGCLDSIATALSAAASRPAAEIIVVDNASKDHTSEVVREWIKTAPCPVRLLLEPEKGLSNARNCGLGAARGDLLVFTDDDCRLSRDYINDLLRHDAADTGLVLRGGRVDPGDATDLPLSIKTQTSPQRWSLADNAARGGNLADSIFGCNMAMRREVIDRIGAFDNRFGAGSPIPGGEDTDYVFRAYLAGIVIEYVPDMAVSHYHGRKSAAEGNRLLRNYSIGSGALFAKYLWQSPGLCRPLYWDARNALKDALSGANSFMPELGFSHRDKVACYMAGMARFLATLPARFSRKVRRHAG